MGEIHSSRKTLPDEQFELLGLIKLKFVRNAHRGNYGVLFAEAENHETRL